MLKYFLYVNDSKSRAVLHDRKCNKTKNLDLALKEQQISRDAMWYGFKHKEDAIKKMQKTDCERQLKHTCMYKH